MLCLCGLGSTHTCTCIINMHIMWTNFSVIVPDAYPCILRLMMIQLYNLKYCLHCEIAI